MRTYNILCKLMLPLIHRKSGVPTGRRYSELRRSERFPRSELDKIQLAKLISLLKVANRHVPHYRDEHFGAVSGLQSAREILACLPILNRRTIKDAGTNMRNMNCGRVQKTRTGGTTGEPLEIWMNNETISVGTAALWRGKAWAGIRPWDKAVSVQGFGKGSWYGRLRMRLLRKWTLESFQPKAEERERIGRLILKIQPAALEGYVTDLLAIADGYDYSTARIKAVFVTGEMLYSEQKENLERAFSAPVFSYYGCNEISSLAYQCEFGNKHVTDEHVIIETVNESGDVVWDEPGRLLVTDLDNHAMPLIRYEVGDIGILTRKQCDCGRTLLVLSELLGRKQDALQNESGDKLSAVFFAGRFRGLKHVEQIQLVQHGLSKVEILYVGEKKNTESELKAVADEIKDRLGNKMEVWATRVNHVPLTPRGKRLLIRGLSETSK